MTASAPQTARAVCAEQPACGVLTVGNPRGQSMGSRVVASPPAGWGRDKRNGRAESQRRKLPDILESSRRCDWIHSTRGAPPQQKEKPAARTTG